MHSLVDHHLFLIASIQFVPYAEVADEDNSERNEERDNPPDQRVQSHDAEVETDDHCTPWDGTIHGDHVKPEEHGDVDSDHCNPDDDYHQLGASSTEEAIPGPAET